MDYRVYEGKRPPKSACDFKCSLIYRQNIVGHCSKFVVVIGSGRFKSRTNGSNRNPWKLLKDIVESKIFTTRLNGSLFS